MASKRKQRDIKPENKTNGNHKPYFKEKREKEPPPPPEETGKEYELNGAKIKELGFSGGALGIRCNIVERDGLRYMQLTTHNGQSLPIYDFQVEWIEKRIAEFREWKPTEKPNEVAA